MKSITIPLAVLFCLPLLAGCGSDDSGTAGDRGSNTEVQRTAGAPGETEGRDQPGQILPSSGDRERPVLEEDLARAGVAVLVPTKGHEAAGTVRFQPADGGVRIDTEMANLPEGRHAYHVHLYGDCTADDGTSAGTHFNFRGPSRNPPEDIDRITGDLGEVVADAQGNASHSAVVEHASLTGPKSIIGRSVVVHASGNDPEQPPIGAAGPRLACGVIGIAEPNQ